MNCINNFWKPDRRFPSVFRNAYPPLPRSTWIHYHVPVDTYDVVCKRIWARDKKITEDLDTWEKLAEGSRNTLILHMGQRQRAEQKQNVDVKTGNQENMQHSNSEHTVPCPYPPGLRPTHASNPAQPVRPQMDRDTRPKDTKKNTQEPATEFIDRNKIKAPPGFPPHPPPEKALYAMSICKSEDEPKVSISHQSSEGSDSVPLPSVRSAASDSSDDDDDVVLSDMSDNETPQPLKSGLESPRLCDTKVESTTRKPHGQWRLPLYMNLHYKQPPLFSKARRAPMQGPVQTPILEKVNAFNLKAETLIEQNPYDLLADFPSLRHPNDANFKDRKNSTYSAQEKTHKIQKIQNGPREGSSICAGDQKTVVDLQTLDCTSQLLSASISCELLPAKNQLAPRGTDGVSVSARTKATAAKPGTNEAASPQEKARPCTAQQTVSNNRAAALNCVTPNNAKRAGPNQGSNVRVNERCGGPGFNQNCKVSVTRPR